MDSAFSIVKVWICEGSDAIMTYYTKFPQLDDSMERRVLCWRTISTKEHLSTHTKWVCLNQIIQPSHIPGFKVTCLTHCKVSIHPVVSCYTLDVVGNTYYLPTLFPESLQLASQLASLLRKTVKT